MSLEVRGFEAPVPISGEDPEQQGAEAAGQGRGRGTPVHHGHFGELEVRRGRRLPELGAGEEEIDGAQVDPGGIQAGGGGGPDFQGRGRARGRVGSFGRVFRPFVSRGAEHQDVFPFRQVQRLV